MNTFNSTTPLPVELYLASAWVSRGRLYVCGGSSNAQNDTKNIYTAQIDDDGQLSAWKIAGQLPLGGNSSWVAKVDDNRVIIFPGVDNATLGGAVVSTVYACDMAGDGTVKLSPLGSCDRYVSGAAVVALDRRLVMTIGASMRSAPFSRVGIGFWGNDFPSAAAIFDISCFLKYTGDLGVSIVAVTQPPGAAHVGQSTVDQYIQTSRVLGDGTLGPWTQFPVKFTNRLGMASVMTSRGPILSGGYNTLDEISFAEIEDIWRIKMNAHGDAIGIETLGRLSTPRDGHAAASNDKFMYLIGGEDVNSAKLNSIEIFDIRGL